MCPFVFCDKQAAQGGDSTTPPRGQPFQIAAVISMLIPVYVATIESS